MRIEMDLVRAILLCLEAEYHGQVISQIVLPEWTDDQIAYHVWYLAEAGYISAKINTQPDCTTPLTQNMIFAIDGVNLIGHEFAEDIRCHAQWTKLKSIAADIGIDGLGAMHEIVVKYLA